MVYPVFLDEKHFLYSTIIDPKQPGVYVASLDSGEGRRLLTDISNSAYAPPRNSKFDGHILFVRDSTLMAQPVDARSFEPRGEPFPVVEQVNSGSQIGYGQFSTSPNGTLVYQAGQGINGRQLAWFDRGGRQLGIVAEAGRIWDFSISPDDKRLAIARTDVQLRTSDLWIHDLQHGTETRFTSHPSLNQRPVWSFDGARIMFSSSRAGRTDLYRKLSSGTAPEETVLTTDYPKYAMDSS
ncbi:MAG: hypothetical protein DMG14_34895, partial [Acidobacteria bacterium]